ncbi:hypothetical protein Q3G72_030259 [Acer saccharum]|nr:hypothetical protein Q3G72_030259 [Acer saccharum]
MFWSTHHREEQWLRRCAIGILKSFSNLESVNERLRNRGFQFTSHFIGSKSVLWCFDSEIDKDGFINNRFFWDDRFASMKNWSENPNPYMRMTWINCMGIPLCYWSSEFFVKLGWVIGEPLLVDEDTISRKRLDKGRILVLVQQQEMVSSKVKVDVGRGSFSVMVKEEETQVCSKWIEQFLGLQMEDTFRKKDYGSEEEEREKVGEKIGSRGQVRIGEWEAQDTAGEWQTRRQTRRRKTAGRRKKESETSSFEMSEGDRDFSNLPRKIDQEKGKMKWVPKPRKSAQKEGFGKLFIGKKQSHMGRGVVSDTTATSLEEGLMSDFNRWRGECSRKEPNQEGRVSRDIQNSNGLSLDGPIKDYLVKMGKSGGPNVIGPQDAMVSRSQSLDGPLKEYLENIEQAFLRAKVRQGVFLHPEQDSAPNLNITDERSSPINSVSIVQETKHTDEEEVNTQENKDSSDSGSSEAEEDKDRGSFKSISATKEVGEVVSEPTLSKPRRGKKRLKKSSKLNRKKERKAENGGEGMIPYEDWNVEEEVKKVMDMGVRLGLNFNGKEREMAEFIRRKEKEDTDRYGQIGRQ